jgi:hypothetical protein
MNDLSESCLSLLPCAMTVSCQGNSSAKSKDIIIAQVDACIRYIYNVWPHCTGRNHIPLTPIPRASSGYHFGDINGKAKRLASCPSTPLTTSNLIAAPPPALPPSIEDAYRRKCIQLKTRLNEVEESNDASRLRLVRIQRGIEKLRLERAFLLEQLSKRTSTNVEDSEGSPSPPPTVCSLHDIIIPHID